MKAVIFAGGHGTRLWPLSRKSNPKQFMELVNNRTMLQMCYDRIESLFGPDDMYVATGVQIADTIHEQLPDIPEHHVIAEPVRRDLGPAVGLAAAVIGKNYPNEPLAYFWGADQIYKNEEKYRAIFKTTQSYLSENPDRIVLIGDKARFPNQNVGWISFGDVVSTKNNVDFHEFKAFHAKPDYDTAQKFYADPKYTWNIGDFITTPGKILQLYEKHAPEMYMQLMTIQKAYGTDAYQDVLNDVYPQMEEVSLDNAIFEKMDTRHAVVVTGDVHYADIGAWNTYKEALENSPADTVTEGNVRNYNTKDSVIFNADDSKLVTTLDLDDIVVVNTKDVVFVGKKSSIHNIKRVVNDLMESEDYKDKV